MENLSIVMARNLCILICLSAIAMQLGCANTGQRSRQVDSAVSVAPRTSIGFDQDQTSNVEIQQVTHTEADKTDDVKTMSVDPIQTAPYTEYVESASVPVDVESLVAKALATNPAIKEAHAALCKARGIHVQVGLKPNPTLGYFAQEVGNDGAAGQHGAFVSQTFVRGDKLQWNRDVVSKEIKQLSWQVESQRRRVETDVRVRFYQALTAQKKLEQAKEFRQEAKRASELSQRRLDAEEGTRPDLLQSQILVDEIDLSIQTSQLEWEAAWGRLAAVVATSSLTPTELVGEFPTGESIDAESIYQQIAAESPVLNSARSRVDRARSNLARQRQQAIPNLNAQLGAGYDDATGDGFANLQLGMPIPVHNWNQGNICAAQAEHTAALQSLERLRLLIRQQVADANRRYQTAAAAVSKYETAILPKAEQSLRLVQRAACCRRNRVPESSDGSPVLLRRYPKTESPHAVTLRRLQRSSMACC